MGISGAVHPSANARITGVKTKYKLEQEPEIGVVSGGGVAPSGWDLTGASYDGISLLVSGEDASPTGVFIRSAGDKLFMTGSAADATYRYSLPTPWSLTGGSYDVGTGFDHTAQDAAPNDNFFNPDGTKMYIMGSNNGQVYEYNLLIAGDPSSAVYTGDAFPVTGETTDPVGIFFNDVGTKLYALGVTNRTIAQYTMNTPWSFAAGGSYDGKSFVFGSPGDTPIGLFIKPGGDKLFITEATGNTIQQFSMSIPGDVDTLVYQKSFDVSFEGTNPQDVFFKEDGLKMYTLDTTNGRVYQYTLLTS